MRYDVVVVGAGVAGLTTALKLAKSGWKVAIVESKSKDKIGDKVCGDAIGIHHFEEIDLKPPESTIDHRYKGVKIYSPSRRHSIIVPGEGVSVNRIAFGQWLLKEALNSRVELLDQHVVHDVEVANGFVKSIKAKRPQGPKIEIEAKVFVDASGYMPSMRSKLPRDWPISDRPYTTDYNIAYREVIKLEDQRVEPGDVDYALIYIDVNIAPGGYWWLFPKTPRGDVINLGLGVINNGQYNPRHNFEKYLRPLFKGKIVHAGGGVVPTRRPLPTLVWRNIVSVGDAAYTVNPVHGGGIGSSMLSGAIASKYIDIALSKGSIDEYTMWGMNIEYMYQYGGKQASLDILRMYMQKLNNEEYEWLIANKIVDGESVYDIGVRGNLGDKIAHTISSLIRLLGRPSLLNELRVVKHYMDKAKKLFTDEYPRTPSEIYKWMKTVDDLYLEYTTKIGYNRGSLVKW